jgi:thiamine biosynthesis lipoprotein
MSGDVRFLAMGSYAHVVVHGDSRLLEVASRRLAVLEARWSRFRPASELSQLNAASGRPMIVSADTVQLFTAMRDAYVATNGTYQPRVLEAMETLGYCCPLPDLAPPASMPAARPVRPFLVDIDARANIVRLVDGTKVDPGGIGKGLAADMVADELMAAGAVGVLVNVGGDVRVRGVPEQAAEWSIAVEHPDDPRRTIAIVRLADGGVATSTVARRRWSADDGTEIHHLVDPNTSQPAATHFRQATVVSGRTQWAEVYAKCALIDGALPDCASAAVLTVADDDRIEFMGTDAEVYFGTFVEAER